MGKAGRSALVVGSTRGIGRAVANRLRDVGYYTAGTYRVGGCVPEGILPVKMDIGDADSIVHGMKVAAEALGGVDVLVVTAGITRDKLLMRMNEKDISEVMRINAIGPMLVCKEALEPMIKQRHGSIVLVSSMSTKYGVVGQCNYTASKGALEAFTRSMAREYASRGIRVNIVAPGAVDTDMMGQVSTTTRTEILADIPLNRFGTPEEIAFAIVNTAESTYMSGATIPIGGGI